MAAKKVRMKCNVKDVHSSTQFRNKYFAKIAEIVTVINERGDVLMLENINGVRFSIHKDKVTEL